MTPSKAHFPLTHENLGSVALQRRWRVRMGLGPHGGMHSPQVLHSDQEPFPAMRGGVPESELEVLVGW